MAQEHKHIWQTICRAFQRREVKILKM